MAILATGRIARTWPTRGARPSCPVEAHTQDPHPREAAPDGLCPIFVPRPWASRRADWRLWESGGAPRRDGRGPPDSACRAPPYPPSARRDDRTRAPHPKSSPRGGRFQVGRARAALPVDLRTLDGSLWRALRGASASRLAAPPGGLLTVLDISTRYRHLGHFLTVDVLEFVTPPLRAWRRWSSGSARG